MRSEYKLVDFEFTNLPGWDIGPPTRGILHTDGNPRPHTALAALQWGNRERAFSIHYYVEGQRVYRAIPENFIAFHVKEHRKAAAAGHDTTAPGITKPRGDIRAIGIEHVMRPDRSWDAETRLTSVLLGADISRRHPELQWSEHATWDPWTRGEDVGVALWVPDWIADVRDVLAGKEPHRVVDAETAATPPPVSAPTTGAPASTLEERVARVEEEVAGLRVGLTRVEKLVRG